MSMSDKTFIKTLIVVVTAGVILTGLHMAYVVHAYRNSSIIYFISQELWP